MVILQADCDLDYDFNQREPSSGAAKPECDVTRLLPEVLLCDLYGDREIRARTPSGSKDNRTVNQNQNERFHRLPAARISNSDQSLPELFLDFRQTYMDKTESLYRGVIAGSIVRIAIIPPIYVHDLMHRFFGFHSRVGLPPELLT
jgi:hypothetical protein